MGNYRKNLGAAPAVVVSSGPAGARLGRARSRRLALIAAAVALSGASGALAQQNERMKLLPADGAEADSLGTVVAVYDTTAIVGAYFDDDNGENSGSVYVFDVITGEQLLKLLPQDGSSGDRFGEDVAIFGSRAIIGAPFDDQNGLHSGSAYVFDCTTGQQLAKLSPGDTQIGHGFGNFVAMTGTTAIIGAPGDDENGDGAGAAYLFDVITGEQLVKLRPADGAARLNFGIAVAISETTAAVGSWDDDNGINSGSAYLFDLTTGAQITKLLPADGAESALFGGSVAFSGSLVIVGASGDNDKGSRAGAIYLFDATTGQQVAKLYASDGHTEQSFGHSVSAYGTVAVVGTGDESAYIFDLTEQAQVVKLIPSDNSVGDNFGASVAIFGDTAVVGAPGDQDNGDGSGSAYVFSPCEADLTGDGVVDTLDFLLFLGAWAQGDPLADWDGNGTINTLDFLAYLNDWVAGC